MGNQLSAQEGLVNMTKVKCLKVEPCFDKEKDTDAKQCYRCWHNKALDNWGECDDESTRFQKDGY